MYRTSPWAKYCHVLRHFRQLPLVLPAFQVTADSSAVRSLLPVTQELLVNIT